MIQSGLCVLMETIRQLALHDKELAHAQVGTLINNGVRGRCAWSPENTLCTARLRT